MQRREGCKATPAAVRLLADLPDVLTVREAAEVLRISSNSVYDALHSGEIPSVRIGRRYLIPRHELQKLLGTDKEQRPAIEQAPDVLDPIDNLCAAASLILKQMLRRSDTKQGLWCSAS